MVCLVSVQTLHNKTEGTQPPKKKITSPRKERLTWLNTIKSLVTTFTLFLPHHWNISLWHSLCHFSPAAVPELAVSSPFRSPAVPLPCQFQQWLQFTQGTVCILVSHPVFRYWMQKYYFWMWHRFLEHGVKLIFLPCPLAGHTEKITCSKAWG